MAEGGRAPLCLAQGPGSDSRRAPWCSDRSDSAITARVLCLRRAATPHPGPTHCLLTTSPRPSHCPRAGAAPQRPARRGQRGCPVFSGFVRNWPHCGLRRRRALAACAGDAIAQRLGLAPSTLAGTRDKPPTRASSLCCTRPRALCEAPRDPHDPRHHHRHNRAALGTLPPPLAACPPCARTRRCLPSGGSAAAMLPAAPALQRPGLRTAR